VRVGSKVAGCPEWLHEPAENGEVALGRLKNERARLGEPAINHFERLSCFKGVRKQLRTRGKPHEGEHDGPCESNRLSPGKERLQPRAGVSVVRRVLVECVQEKIDVRKFHP
jgi:hypothetical protein